MAKPFLLGVEIEEAAFGKVMRKINALPGVIALHMDFQKPNKSGDKRQYNGGATRNKFKENGDVVIMRLFGGRKDKKVTLEQMREQFSKEGRSPSSVHNLSFSLTRAGAIKKIDKGVYVLGDPKKVANAKQFKGKRSV